MSINFLFASQLDQQARSRVKWRTFSLVSAIDGNSLRTWEHIRYEMEQQLECVKDKIRYSVCSYLSAMRRDVYKLCECKFSPEHRLRAHDVVSAGSTIVLFRRPPPRFFTRVVPTRYNRATVGEDQGGAVVDVKLQGLTEDEQVALIGEVSQQLLDTNLSALQRVTRAQRAAAQRAHPDDYEYTADRKPVPPAEYVCKGCGCEGVHFRQDCPEDGGEEGEGGESEVKAVDKIFVPTGIPKTFLQSVEESEANEQTMVTRDGQFVQDVRQGLLDRVKEIDAREICVVRRELNVDTWEDGEAVRFDFEDYLEQVVDVKERELKALVKKKVRFICTHWLQGLCHKGFLCEYLHYYDVGLIPICKFYMEGKCTNDPCAFRHVLPTPRTHTMKCADFIRGFCPRGPACVHQHIKRAAPCLADFDTKDAALFHATVQAFDAFMAEHRKAEVMAKKRYMRAPSVTEMLYTRTKRKKMGGDNKAP